MNQRQAIINALDAMSKQLSSYVPPIGIIAKMFYAKVNADIDNRCVYYSDVIDVISEIEFKITNFTDTPDNIEILQKFVDVYHQSIVMVIKDLYTEANGEEFYYNDRMYRTAGKIALKGSTLTIDFSEV